MSLTLVLSSLSAVLTRAFPSSCSALLAGGFGRAGEFTHNDRPLEIAAVVPSNADAIGSDPYFQRRFPASPPPGRAESFGDKKELDIEEAGSQEAPSLKTWEVTGEEAPVGEFDSGALARR